MRGAPSGFGMARFPCGPRSRDRAAEFCAERASAFRSLADTVAGFVRRQPATVPGSCGLAAGRAGGGSVFALAERRAGMGLALRRAGRRERAPDRTLS